MTKNCQINERTQFQRSVIDFEESDKDAIYPQSLTEGINGAQKTDDSSHFSTPLKDTSLLCL